MFYFVNYLGGVFYDVCAVWDVFPEYHIDEGRDGFRRAVDTGYYGA